MPWQPLTAAARPVFQPCPIPAEPATRNPLPPTCLSVPRVTRTRAPLTELLLASCKKKLLLPPAFANPANLLPATPLTCCSRSRRPLRRAFLLFSSSSPPGGLRRPAGPSTSCHTLSHTTPHPLFHARNSPACGLSYHSTADEQKVKDESLHTRPDMNHARWWKWEKSPPLWRDRVGPQQHFSLSLRGGDLAAASGDRATVRIPLVGVSDDDAGGHGATSVPSEGPSAKKFKREKVAAEETGSQRTAQMTEHVSLDVPRTVEVVRQAPDPRTLMYSAATAFFSLFVGRRPGGRVW